MIRVLEEWVRCATGCIRVRGCVRSVLGGVLYALVGVLVGVLVGKSKQHIGRNSVLIVCQKG